jgi:aerobic carbon-monoxide dehydrogenase medium subunit
VAPFELMQPRSLGEALSLLDPHDTSVRPMAGGTALMLMMKTGVFRPRRLVSLEKLEMAKIDTGPAGELRLGAMARLADIERSPIVKRGWPVIVRTLLTLSNIRVRNVARLGGHLAHADPHTDLPPLLSALRARAIVTGPGGERTIAVEAISRGYLESSLQPNELLTCIEVPVLGASRAAYMKCTSRSADDWPALGVAAVLTMDKDLVKEASLVVSAATDRPTRLAAAEKILRGSALNDQTLKRAAEAAAEEVQIESDLHGSSAYKKQLLRVYLGRAIHEACK